MRRAWSCWARKSCSACIPGGILRRLPTPAGIVSSAGLRRAAVDTRDSRPAAGDASLHQIAERSHATSRFVARASGALQATLPLLAVALGIDVTIGVVGYAGTWSVGIAGGAFVLLAILVWHVVPMCAATRRERKDEPMAAQTKVCSVAPSR
jgi:hypothetical protein